MKKTFSMLAFLLCAAAVLGQGSSSRFSNNMGAAGGGIPASGAVRNGVTYSSLSAAYAGAASGDSIYLYGTTSISSKLTMSNVTVLAYGATLLNANTNSVGTGNALAIAVGNNLSWYGGTISNTFSGVYGGCMGFDIREGDRAATNFWLQDVRGWGDSDCFFFNATNAVSGTLVNCFGESLWDPLVVVHPGRMKFVGGRYVVNGLSTLTAADPRACKIAGGNNVFQGVGFEVNATNAQDVVVARNDAPAFGPVDYGSTNMFEACTFGGSMTNAGGSCGVRAVSSPNLIILSGCMVNPDFSQAPGSRGVRAQSTGSLKLYNTTVLPLQTNIQASVFGSGSQTLTVSGGNVVHSRIEGANFSTRLFWEGDLGTTNNMVGNLFVTNVQVAATSAAPSDTVTEDAWWQVQVGGSTYRIKLFSP